MTSIDSTKNLPVVSSPSPFDSPSPDTGLDIQTVMVSTDHTHTEAPTNSPATTQDYFPVSPKITRQVPEREDTLPDSDLTCLPPVTAHRARTLVLCFDGTGDKFDNDNSNIAKIFSMLKKDDKNLQMCYYQAGIGTYLNHHTAFPGAKTFDKLVDEAVARFLSAHVKEGYRFLMQNYVVGDKVCLLGFSRGAYTARVLAGMLHKVGLLPADNKDQIAFAWRMFKDTSESGWRLSRQFKDSFCTDVNIEYIGVFDTVSSIGLLGRRLPFTASNHGIRYFRQAMALDERRARFKVNHWMKMADVDEKYLIKRPKAVRKGHEAMWKEDDDFETDIKEVWFAGCHCDVGGGNVSNDERNSLARIPLRWMIREIFRCKTGILWDLHGLQSIGLDPDCLYPEVTVHHPQGSLNSFKSSHSRFNSLEYRENVETERNDTAVDKSGDYRDDPERQDALCRTFDELELAPWWWILELFPTKGKKQVLEDIWKDYYFVNLGRGRIVPKLERGMLVHRSVKLRLDEGNYITKAIYDMDPTWVG